MNLFELFEEQPRSVIIEGETPEQKKLIKYIKENRGSIIADLYYTNGQDKADIGKKGSNFFALYPDGTYTKNKSYDYLGQKGWTLNESKSKRNLEESKILIKKIAKILEQEDHGGSIDWEPQPEYKGAKGITGETGLGKQQHTVGEKKKAQEKLNSHWVNLLKKLKSTEGANKKKLLGLLNQLVVAAEKRGFQLKPEPSSIMGLDI